MFRFPLRFCKHHFSSTTFAQLLPDHELDRQPIADLNAFFKQKLGDGRIFSFDNRNIAMLMDGVSDLWGYGPNSPVRRYAEFIAYTQGGDPDDLTGYQQFKSTSHRFDMLRCKYVFADDAIHGFLLLPFVTPKTLPRFSSITDWSVEPRHNAVFKAIVQSEFDPRATVMFERGPSRPAGRRPLARSTTPRARFVSFAEF